jgi:pyruvate carboxylase
MCGDIIKVTPSSKAVGDMALFMTQNNLTPETVITRSKDLAFPDSFVSMMKGMMGQPEGGFPPALQKAVLKGEEPITCRPGELLEDFDFDAAAAALKQKFGRDFDEEQLSSYAQYPKVYTDYVRYVDHFGDVSVLDTPTFFYGLKVGQEQAITIQEGKTLIVKLLAIGDLQPDGTRIVFWELNGRRRNTVVVDNNSGIKAVRRDKADPDNPGHIAAPMAGKVVELSVTSGEKVAEGQKLMTTEAMKMLNVIKAPSAGTLKRMVVQKGDEVSPGDLVMEIQPG